MKTANRGRYILAYTAEASFEGAGGIAPGKIKQENKEKRKKRKKRKKRRKKEGKYE